ncbi:hypothetical protein diail_12396, partial [Diaporthe ilicicola]
MSEDALALGRGKTKNKVLKLTATMMKLAVEQAQGQHVAAEMAEEQAKLDKNIADDAAEAGASSADIQFDASTDNPDASGVAKDDALADQASAVLDQSKDAAGAKDGERSASSATRFTATTPHASSKARSAPLPGAGGPRKPVAAARASTPNSETPEQRVARLRAAHERAKTAQVSRFDLLIAKSRPFFDSAHKITVISLVGLTAVAGVMTAYTAYDMLRYNRKRKAEFLEAQQRMSADSLEAARLAYMRGDASDEQISLVEEANARAGGEFKLPSILSSPKPITRNEEVSAQTREASGAGDAASGETKSSGLFGWFSSKKSSQNATEGSEAPRTLEDKQDMLRKAREAFEKEKETQRSGGPLDRLGIEASTAQQPQSKEAEQPKKKGW